MRRHSSAQKCAASEAKSLAIPASMSGRSPPSFMRAAGGATSRAARGQPGGVDRRRQCGELELDRLVLGYGLAEGLALLAVAQRELQSALGEADAAGGDVRAADLQRVHHLREAAVQAALLAAEDALGRRAIAVIH